MISRMLVAGILLSASFASGQSAFDKASVYVAVILILSVRGYTLNLLTRSCAGGR